MGTAHQHVLGALHLKFRIPGLWAFKNHYIAWGWIMEVIAQLLHRDAVIIAAGAAVQRGFHRRGGNNVHTANEGLQ